MITKNKQSPTTLYLLNAKTINKIEQQRKSARLTFNKKKSTRSISQYQKWNASKQTISGPFQPATRTNSQIKKIVLNKNQFGIQNLPIEKKLCYVLQIFTGGQNKRKNTLPESSEKQLQKRKSHQNRSGQLSLLSIKDMNEKQKEKQKTLSKRISHMRTQSMLNHSEYQNNIELVLAKVDRRFKQYQRLSEDWRLQFSTDQSGLILDDMMRSMKALFSEVTSQYSNEIINNLQYFQDSLSSVAKQYEIQINTLKQELTKADNVNNTIRNLAVTLNQKHYKGVICTKIFEDIQRNGTNLQELIKNSAIYEQIVQISQKNNDTTWPQICNKTTYDQNPQIVCLKARKNQVQSCHSDEDFYQEQKLDYVQNDSNWNNHFQNRQSIKGVLKYINNRNDKNNHNSQNNNNSQNNHNSQNNQQNEMSKNLNSTSSVKLQKGDKPNMKIDNWKSFQNNDKISNPYKKIMSQR